LIKIWDAEGAALCQTLKGHSCSVSSVQFTDDGSRVVSVSGCDRSLRIWDTLTAETIMILRGTPVCNSAVMAPGNQQLAGAMADGTVRNWDARPLTPEICVDRQVRGIVESAFHSNLDVEQAVKEIYQDTMITNLVRQKALKLARESATAYLDRAAVAII